MIKTIAAVCYSLTVVVVSVFSLLSACDARPLGALLTAAARKVHCWEGSQVKRRWRWGRWEKDRYLKKKERSESVEHSRWPSQQLLLKLLMQCCSCCQCCWRVTVDGGRRHTFRWLAPHRWCSFNHSRFQTCRWISQGDKRATWGTLLFAN